MQQDQTNISYRSMQPGEAPAVVDFVLKIFNEFVAPHFSREGIDEFKQFVRSDDMLDRFKDGNPILLAELERRIIGVIELREDSHIALLFVDKAYQRRGIARELIRRSIAICRKHNPQLRTLTVNASPNAYTAYQTIGFERTDDEMVVNGIRFIPMALALDEWIRHDSVELLDR